jgi:hypothetical protein
MTIFRLVTALLLVAVAGYIVIMNWMCAVAAYRNWRKGVKKNISSAPLVSIILAIPAWFLYPWSPKVWIWVIPLADISNWHIVLWFCGFPVRWIRERISGPVK